MTIDSAEALAALQAEVELLRAVTETCCNKQGELRKDAERYRWARQQETDKLMDLYINIPGSATPEEFDAAIDAAMGAVIDGDKHG